MNIIMKRTENVRNNLPSLHPSPISFPDCLPSLYFWNSTRNRWKQQNIINFLSNTKPKFELSVIVICRGTWRWLFKWKRVKPLTFIVRIIAFGVASADRIKHLSVNGNNYNVHIKVANTASQVLNNHINLPSFLRLNTNVSLFRICFQNLVEMRSDKACCAMPSILNLSRYPVKPTFQYCQFDESIEKWSAVLYDNL